MAGRSFREPRTFLEHLLREQDRTYEEITDEFEKLARRLGERGVGISSRHLRRLASGERVGTTPATRRVLQAFFNMPVQELLKPWAPDGSTPASPLGGVASSVHSETELLIMAVERSRNFAFNRQTATSGETVDQIEDEVRQLALSYPCQPLPMVLGKLVSAQDVVLSLLDLRQKPMNARRLYFLATVLAGLLAYAGNDVGKPQIALAHARTAFLWAEYADHNGLRAWIRGLQSFISYWADQPREAIRYAQSGAEFATAARSTAGAWLSAGEARAWAAVGDVGQTRSLIERAERMMDESRPDELDDFGGLCTFTRSKQLYYVARALACLRQESAAAERSAIEAVEAYEDPNRPGWDFSCQADSRISLALARVSRGELDGVAESLRPVFDLPSEHRIHDLVQTMNLVHRALNGFRQEGQARDLQEQIEIFSRASLPRFPV